jgi:hypothetical protein
MEDAPPVANQIDLFMHFLGASRDGLVARPVEMDKLSSSVSSQALSLSLSPKTKPKYHPKGHMAPTKRVLQTTSLLSHWVKVVCLISSENKCHNCYNFV